MDCFWDTETSLQLGNVPCIKRCLGTSQEHFTSEKTVRSIIEQQWAVQVGVQTSLVGCLQG